MSIETLYTRDAPYIAEILDRNSYGRVFSLRLSIDPEIGYAPGDSVAILPRNDEKRIEWLIDWFGQGTPDLFEEKSIHHVTGKFLRLALAYAKDPTEIEALLSLGRITDRFIPLWEVLEVCEGMPLEGCLEHLSPLLPRYYSIASANSQRAVDLLVSKTEMLTWRGERLLGLCTDYLSHRVPLGSPAVRLYLHRSEHFRLPEDPHADVIMIGPGTGIAPFRAFLHVRAELPGNNWLFFGARSKACDFYYEEELKGLETRGKLKLTTAFSRDGGQKVYVQDRILEEADLFWEWLQRGAYLYICGDAKQMARDVMQVLDTMAKERGAPTFFKELRASGRFALDVY